MGLFSLIGNAVRNRRAGNASEMEKRAVQAKGPMPPDPRMLALDDLAGDDDGPMPAAPQPPNPMQLQRPMQSMRRRY